MEASPLTAVRLVLRQKLAINAPDVVGVVITEFLARDLTLRQACDLSPAGSTVLLEFVCARGLRAVESKEWSVGKMIHTQPHYSRWAFTRAMVGAVHRGDLVMVQWLRGRFPDCPIYVEILREACKCGRLDALQLLHSVKDGRDFQWSNLEINSAAEFGHWDVIHWDVIHWLYDQYPDMSLDGMLAFALGENNLEEMKWLTAHSDDTYVGEAYLPYFEEMWRIRKDCVRYLVARGQAVEDVVMGAVQTAAEGGDLEFVQWLTSHPLDHAEYVYKQALYCACEHGHIQVARYLLTRMEELGPPSELSDIMDTASRCGQLRMVQWIYERYGRNAQINLFEVVRGLTTLEVAPNVYNDSYGCCRSCRTSSRTQVAAC